MGQTGSKNQLLPYQAKRLYEDFSLLRKVVKKMYDEGHSFLGEVRMKCNESEGLFGSSWESWKEELVKRGVVGKGWKRVVKLFGVLCSNPLPTDEEKNQIFYDIQSAVSDSVAEEVEFFREQRARREEEIVCCPFFSKITGLNIDKSKLISFVRVCGFDQGESISVAECMIRTFNSVKAPVVLNETDPMTNSCTCFFCWARNANTIPSKGEVASSYDGTKPPKRNECCATYGYYLDSITN
jgi:hypothetical protein